jgi:hypothetical protein
MKPVYKHFILWIIPLAILAWGIFILWFYDPYSVRASDPEYPYLINGLNVAILDFSRIGHTDHPGTPFQLYCGLIIRICHWITGKEDIAFDVMNRPDIYLNYINFSLTILQAVLIGFIGFFGKKRGIGLLPLFFLQTGAFCNPLILSMFNRVFPERWLVITSLLFILAFILFGYKQRKPLVFVLTSGVIMAMGMATKFNYLPILLLPLLLFKDHKSRLLYTGAGIASFIIFILPVIKRFGDFRRFITAIAQHDGVYGQGEARMFNFPRMAHNLQEMFRQAPDLYLIILLILFLLFMGIMYHKKETFSTVRLFSAGSLIIIALQILMVSKHYKDTYMVPLFSIYGFFLFKADAVFTNMEIKNIFKKSPMILLWLMMLALCITSVYKNINNDRHKIYQRSEMVNFVNQHTGTQALWFVEPTWESAPFVENALIYGLSYCRHKHYYYSTLTRINPHIITFEGMGNPVMSWRIKAIPLDSVLKTGKPLYLYSTPGRQTSILLQELQTCASRLQLPLACDTVYNQIETQTQIICCRLQNINEKEWDISSLTASDQEEQIQSNILRIQADSQWLKKVEAKAKQKGIPLDSMLRLDATWMLENWFP